MKIIILISLIDFNFSYFFQHRFSEKEALINDRYAHVFEAFHLDSTSSNESSGDTTDGRRRARQKFALSDTTSGIWISATCRAIH